MPARRANSRDTASASSNTESIVTNSSTSPVKRRRGRPRKNEVREKQAASKTSITDLLKISASRSRTRGQLRQQQQQQQQQQKEKEKRKEQASIEENSISNQAENSVDTAGTEVQYDGGANGSPEKNSNVNVRSPADEDDEDIDMDVEDGDYGNDDKDDEDFKPEGNSSESEPEVDVQLDKDEEDIIQEVDSPRKEARKNDPTITGPNELRRPVRKQPRQVRLRIIRTLRDLSSVEEKIARLYSRNEKRLLEFAKMRRAWEQWLFNFPIKNIQPDFPLFVPVVSQCQEPNVYAIVRKTHLQEPQYCNINDQEYKSLFTDRPEPLKVNIHDLDTKLRANEKVEIPVLPHYTRTALVMNVGGLITDLAWLTNNGGSEDEPLYLAVSVSQYYDEPASEYLGVFDGEEHISAIKIYKLDPVTFKFTNIQTIVHPYGETWDLKWHDNYKSDEAGKNIGLLGFVCQGGSLKFIEIDLGEKPITDYRLYDNVKFSFSIDGTSITCFDFLTATVVICGFKNGFVAEFDLSSGSTAPSYYHRLHESYVVQIVAAYSKYEETAVASVSLDGYFHIFDPRDIYSSKIAPIQRFRGNLISPMTYCPQLYSVVFSDGVSSIKATVPRAAFGVHQISYRPSTVTALHSSRLHPLILSATSDGSLYVDNLMRRLLGSVKAPIDGYKSLRLWKWDFDRSTDTYRLDFNYEAIKCSANEVRQLKIDPHGVGITCVKWNETYRGGKFYAFGNAAGLLTIEQMEPIE